MSRQNKQLEGRIDSDWVDKGSTALRSLEYSDCGVVTSRRVFSCQQMLGGRAAVVVLGCHRIVRREETGTHRWTYGGGRYFRRRAVNKHTEHRRRVEAG